MTDESAFIDERILSRAETIPDAPALGDPDTERPITFAELARSTDTTAQGLRDAGLRHGETVPILSGNSVDLVVALLAVMRAGGVAAPISDPARFTPPDTRLILAPPEHGKGVALEGLRRLLLHGDARDPVEPMPRTAEDTAYLLHTSGTTGAAKRIRMRHATLAGWSRSTSRELELASDAAHCIPLPIAHSYPLWQTLGALAEGCLCWVVDGLSRPAPFFDILRERGIDSLCATPSLLRLSLGRYAELFTPAARALRSVYTNSEPVPPGLAAACLQAAPNARLVMLYGLSEAPRTSVRIVTRDTLPTWHGDVGWPMTGATVTLSNARELLIGGPHLANGLARPHATGDMGQIAENGSVTVLGRRDTTFTAGGGLMTAETVELALSPLAAVLDASAIAEANGNGYALLAVGGKGRTEQDLRQAVLAHLPVSMHPNRIVLARRIPRLPNGKIDRVAARALLDSTGS